MKNIYFLIFIIINLVACQSEVSSSELKKNSSGGLENQTDNPNLNLDPNRYNVAFLIMDGVYNTELTGSL